MKDTFQTFVWILWSPSIPRCTWRDTQPKQHNVFSSSGRRSHKWPKHTQIATYPDIRTNIDIEPRVSAVWDLGPNTIILLHIPMTRYTNCLKWFLMYLSWRISYIFLKSNSTEVYTGGSKWKYLGNNLVYGLAPMSRQAIAWTITRGTFSICTDR